MTTRALYLDAAAVRTRPRTPAFRTTVAVSAASVLFGVVAAVLPATSFDVGTGPAAALLVLFAAGFLVNGVLALVRTRRPEELVPATLTALLADGVLAAAGVVLLLAAWGQFSAGAGAVVLAGIAVATVSATVLAFTLPAD
ncbi:hypothetical protein [Nocardia thailandica]